MSTTAAVVVYGATGHTGRFVVAELRRRGFATVISGRDADRLEALAAEWGDVQVRPATVDDAGSLDRALAGAAAVVNCAGPFALTAGPVVEAALRAGIPYVDVAAEIEANVAMFADHAEAARKADTPVVPAMAFYGGLGDLLVTAAMGEWTAADAVHVAYGLNGWHPTPGTRVAGRVSHERRAGRRVRFAGPAGLRHLLRSDAGGTWGPALVAVFGVSFWAAAAFPADAGAGFPVGAPDPTVMSGHGAAHMAAGMVGYLALCAAFVVLSRPLAARGHRGWAVASRLVPVAVLAGFMASAASVLAFTAGAGLGLLWLTAVTARLALTPALPRTV
ncbi:DUF998 domain-containing protein [Streptomyces sp. NPDC090045]|uniref:DUF998 domain-containing protein n=1 Tax=Streptomyces sp. NPDC090045 TaxID=3365927 RepID=UPI0038280B39